VQLRPAFQLPTTNIKKRAIQGTFSDSAGHRHSCQSRNAGTAYQPKQDGFSLIVCVMRHQQQVALLQTSFKRLITGRPRSFLQPSGSGAIAISYRRHVYRNNSTGNLKRLAQVLAEPLGISRVRLDLMIHMNRRQFAAIAKKPGGRMEQKD
jgi:hypothetical protein